MTNATVGSVLKSVGNRLNRRLPVAGTFVNSAQGLCFRAYRPLAQPVNPSDGRLSEYPVKPWPVASSWWPRFSAPQVKPHVSEVTPCVEPENSAM